MMPLRHAIENNATKFKLAIVTNMPAPYVIPIHSRVAGFPDVDLHVIYCSQREPNRLWDLPPILFKHTFLRERFFVVGGRDRLSSMDISVGERCIHNNVDVVRALQKLAPDVIVTVGFHPTYLYAFMYALIKRIPHVPMTDGTFDSEKRLGILHKLARRIVYGNSKAFASASLGGRKIYESYGVEVTRCFLSCLCIDNDAFVRERQVDKQFDFIFCGRMEAGKNPLFAVSVAVETAKKLNRKVKILFVGSGSQENDVREAVASQRDWVQAEFAGFAAQSQLPAHYKSARIFLFPTTFDVWGVVANEACAAGIPVLISPHAGAAGELIIDGENGFVCDLDVKVWAERAALLLTNANTYTAFAERGRSLVSEYTFDKAAAGLLAACQFALAAAGGPRNRRRLAIRQLAQNVE